MMVELKLWTIAYGHLCRVILVLPTDKEQLTNVIYLLTLIMRPQSCRVCAKVFQPPFPLPAGLCLSACTHHFSAKARVF